MDGIELIHDGDFVKCYPVIVRVVEMVRKGVDVFDDNIFNRLQLLAGFYV
jgi:hypothetical protein